MKKLWFVLILVVLFGCASMAAPDALKTPGAPTLMMFQGQEVLTWTVPVSATVLASYVPGQKVSIDNGVTFAAIAGLACTGTGNLQTCTAPFPSTTKGTYQTSIQICDTQGTKTKCSTSPKSAIDYLPMPAVATAPSCSGCLTPVTIALDAVAPSLTAPTPLTIRTTGTVASVRLEVLTTTDGSVICECSVTGGPTVWSATLQAQNGVGQTVALRPTAVVAGGSSVVGSNVLVKVG